MIVERIDRAGHVLETYRFNTKKIRIGRGYENDLILHDPYVESAHLVVEYDLLHDRFYVSDLKSVNGVQYTDGVRQKRLEGSVVNIRSGSEVQLGKTRLKLVHEKYQVASALPLSQFETWYGIVGSWWFFVLSIFAVVAIYSFDKYLTSPFNEKFTKNLIEGSFLSIGALMYAGIWVLVGKIQHQEGRFFLHANLTLLLFLFFTIFSMVQPILQFNFEWLMLSGYLEIILECVLLFLVVYISASQFMRISSTLRYAIASFFPLLIVLVSVSAKLDEPDTQIMPRYIGKLVSPKFQWVSGESEEAFLTDVSELFSEND